MRRATAADGHTGHHCQRQVGIGEAAVCVSEKGDWKVAVEGWKGWAWNLKGRKVLCGKVSDRLARFAAACQPLRRTDWRRGRAPRKAAARVLSASRRCSGANSLVGPASAVRVFQVRCCRSSCPLPFSFLRLGPRRPPPWARRILWHVSPDDSDVFICYRGRDRGLFLPWFSIECRRSSASCA